jgi:hypothetical protein
MTWSASTVIANQPKNTQLDWIDMVYSVEQWLEQYVGQRGIDWDYYSYTECQQIEFARERDYVWFTLAWS